MARNREIGELMATKATHHLITDLAARSLLANDTAGASSPVATLVDDLTVLADGSTTRRDLSARAADLCFNVKDFGAIGNGIANDTTAILAAIAAAGIAGGTVFFPHGSYLVNDELLITKDGVRLIGEATSEGLASGSRIVTSSTTKDIIRVSTSAQTISGFEIANLSLYGAGNGGSAGSGLHLDSTTAGRSILGVRLSNLQVKNCKQHGVRFSATNTTGFIFDVVCEKVRTVNNYGSGVRADGLAIQVTWTKLYSELNAASQIALVGADQTTCPQNWLMLGYAAASNPATAGTAALYLENVRGFQAVNVWHESNANAEFILKSCKGVRIDGGRVSQTGTCDGLVIGFSGALGCGNISVDIPGWTNTGSKKRVDVSQFAGGSFQWAIRLGQSADGPITPAEVTGYASAFLADQIFFTPGLVDRVANIIQNGVTFTGTWTTATSLPKTDQRTAADNTTHQRGYYAGLLEGNALIAAVAPLKGRKPYAVDLIYEVTGADAGDDIDFSVATQPWPADNVATAAATAVTTTPDTAHNTAAKRSNSSGGHQYNRMRRTITTPAWLAEGEEFLVTISVVEANNVANALSVKIKAVLVYYYEANA
jgi:hypothetical protein